MKEIKEYFDKLEILESQVKDIDELYQDGGDHIYMAICPLWSGEDDIFSINSAEDATLLPKLKKVTLLYLFCRNFKKETSRQNGCNTPFYNDIIMSLIKVMQSPNVHKTDAHRARLLGVKYS